jgi:hypothetical protein
MSAKAHGTCTAPVQAELMYNVDNAKADKICCFNRHYAEVCSSASAFCVPLPPCTRLVREVSETIGRRTTWHATTKDANALLQTPRT